MAYRGTKEGGGNHRLSRSNLIFLLLLPAIFFGSFLISQGVQLAHQCQRNLDRQLIELSVERASRGEAFGGAYSKEEFQHPGPAYFYYLSLTEHFKTGEVSSHGLFKIATLIFHLLVCLALGFLLWRSYSADAVTLLIFPLLVVSTYHSSKGFILADYWNPYPNISLMLLLLTGCAAFAAAKRGLPFFVCMSLVGSLMIQNHIGAAPVVAIVLAISFASWLYRTKKADRLVSGRLFFWGGVAALLNLFVWGPPLVEFLTYSDSNILRIVQSFLEEKPEKSYLRSSQLMSLFYSTPVAGQAIFSPRSLLVLLTFLPFLFWKGFTATHRFLCLLSFVCCGVTLWAGTKIFVPPQQYLISYFYAVPVVQVFLILSGAMDLLRSCMNVSKEKWRAVMLLPLFCIGALLLFMRYPEPVSQRRCRVNEEITQLVQGIPYQRDIRYSVSLSGEKPPYSFAAPLALAMVRKGYDICFSDDWGYRYGRSLTCSYREDHYTTQSVVPLDLRRAPPGDFSLAENETLVRGVLVRIGQQR